MKVQPRKTSHFDIRWILLENQYLVSVLFTFRMIPSKNEHGYKKTKNKIKNLIKLTNGTVMKVCND